MPSSLPLLVLTAVGLTLSGGLLAWIACETRNARKARAFARAATSQISERYRAYVLLERRIKHTIWAFDLAEREFAEKFTAQHQQILSLRTAVDEFSGEATEVSPAEAVAYMNALWPKLPEGEEEPQAADQDLGDWEDRLAQVTAEKEAELDRQTTVIEDLTNRIHNLEPLGGQAASLTNDLAQAQARTAELEESSRILATEQGVLQAELESVLAAVEIARASATDELQDAKQDVENAHAEAEAAASAHAEAIETLESASSGLRLQIETQASDLSQRKTELETARTEAEASAQASAQTVQELESLGAELRLEVESLNSNLVNKEAQLDRTQTASKDSQAEQGKLVSELEVTLSEVQARTIDLLSELSQAEDRGQDARAHGEELENSLSARDKEQEELQRVLADALEQADQRSTEIEQANDLQANLEAELIQARAAILGAQDDAEGVSKQREQAQAEEREEAAASLERLHTELNQEQKDRAAEVQGLEGRHAAQQQHVEDLEHAGAANAELIEGLRQELEAQTKQAKSKEKAAHAESKATSDQAQQQTSEITAMQEALEVLAQRLEQQTSAMSELQAMHAQTTAQLDTNQETHDTNQRDLEKLLGKTQSELGRTLKIAEKETRDFTERMAATEADTRRAGELADERNAELKDLNEALAKAQSDLDQASNLVSSHDNELDSLQRDLDTERAALNKAKRGQSAALAESKANRQAQQAELRGKQKELTGLQKNLEAAQASADKQAQQHENNASAHAEKLEKVERALAQNSGRVGELESELKSERKALTTAQLEHVDEQRKGARAHAHGISELEARIADRDADLEALRGEHEVSRTETRSLTQRLTDLDVELIERRQRVAFLEARVAELVQEIASLNELSTCQDTQIGQLMSNVNNLSDDLSLKSGALARKLSTFEAAQAMMANLKPMMDALEGQLTEEEGKS